MYIKTLHDYYACLDMEANGKKFDWMALSACSNHPVIDLLVNSREADNQLIYYDNELFTGIISPLGSFRIYSIVKGNCVGMTLCKGITSKITSDAINKSIKKNKEQKVKSLNDTKLLQESKYQ